MRREQFEELLNYHGDIMFKVNGFDFTVLTFDDKFTVGFNDEVFEYNTIDEVLENYLVNGTPLIEVLDDLVLFTCS